MALVDPDLVARARSGDRGAMEQLVARLEPTVYRFGMRMCRDPEDAKDVVQDTLLTVARSLGGFRETSALTTWVYAIARSVCIKKRRRRKAAPDHEASLETEAADDAAAIVDEGQTPEDAASSRETESVVQRAIDALDPTSREVLLLRDAEGLTAPEVAEVLGTSVDAVKSRLHRARLSVRARLEPLLGPTRMPSSATGECPDVVSLLSRHLEDEISADTCAEMERHVAACPRCRTACDSLRRTLALCRASGPDEVPAHVRQSVTEAIRRQLDTLAQR